MAAQNGHAKVVALILAAAAASARQGTVGGGVTEAANVRRTDGATPLWMAAQMGFDNVIRLLMKAGANPEISRNVRKQFTSTYPPESLTPRFFSQYRMACPRF